jgi:hypothetical protein
MTKGAGCPDPNVLKFYDVIYGRTLVLFSPLDRISHAVIAVEFEKSETLLKNSASVINQFANAQTRHIDLILLTKTTVTIIHSLSLTGFTAFAPRFPATLTALF